MPGLERDTKLRDGEYLRYLLHRDELEYDYIFDGPVHASESADVPPLSSHRSIPHDQELPRWRTAYDLQTAMQLSSLLLIFITFFLVLERYSRKNVSYTSGSPTYGRIEGKQLVGGKNFLCFLFCLLPLMIGFILPISELTNWALNYKLDFFDASFIKNSLNTIYLALLVAFLCSSIALIINFSGRIQRNKFFGFLSSSLSLGYGLPGIILAIGIMQLFIFLDNNIIFLNFVFTGSI